MSGFIIRLLAPWSDSGAWFYSNQEPAPSSQKAALVFVTRRQAMMRLVSLNERWAEMAEIVPANATESCRCPRPHEVGCRLVTDPAFDPDYPRTPEGEIA